MKIATSDLKMANGTVAHYAGSEIPDEVLDSEMAKAYGWADLVAGPNTKAAHAAQEAANVPASDAPAAKGKATNAPA